MNHDIQILDELLKLNSADALQRALEKMIMNLGFEMFAYYSESKNGHNEAPTILKNYPIDWIAHYVANDYGDIDPVHLAAKNTLLPFLWGGEKYLKRLSRQQRKLFSEAAKYGICVGLTVPIHSPQRFSALTVASADDSLSFQKRAQKNKSFLQLLALYFHEAVHLTPAASHQPPIVRLTKREQECLLFIAQGFSYGMAAEKMCISRNTVLYFAKNIRRKLSVSNIQHAVAIAIRHNLIDRDRLKRPTQVVKAMSTRVLLRDK